ncbi:unnamed protein product [Brassicogethes aeneus]|uniref:Plasmid pRiA4b Orf3-like domain-containing protein n=1 Tax=Brassicogethes aeneus TaxID=1431903 RepID=A0A9P0BBK9_BRAAE|nr:unnamed protein product [Brassicogethes aeneus]
MNEQIYNFKVNLKFAKKDIYRTIELKGATSLYQFAKEIVRAFDFQFDHAFGFHDNISDMYESNEEYTLFYDDGNPINPNEKSVKQSHIYKVFEPSKKMLFHFDYGDDWMFLVECLGVSNPEAGKDYPIVTKKKGKAPPQYPNYDHSDDDE